ncbi:MAG: hypothetical protein EBZ48_10625 [Proteobacteria bacterium]|nr:hypothetical protein [Pseudomonadota bacterium]
MSAYKTIETLPVRLEVEELVQSRYPGGTRPLSWDDRMEGVDVVRGSDGSLRKLRSDGGQSPPNRGWVIMLTSGDPEHGYSWTLYGLPQQALVQ